MKNITIWSIFLIFAVYSNTQARTIICNSPRIHSTFKTSVTDTQQSITKTVNLKGHKYTLHIEDTTKFSEINDYLSIASSKGYEVTYPIVCELK